MNEIKEIIVLVEGKTESIFIEKVLSPFLRRDAICLKPIILSKPGQKGGDVKFARAQRDIRIHLKQRTDTWVTMMVDYYGIDKEWPGYQESQNKNVPADKFQTINEATQKKVNELFRENNSNNRFIPYVSMHEFEALLFSDAEVLNRELNINDLGEITKIIEKYGSPDAINNDKNTCPLKQIENLTNKKFKKTTNGIEIAQQIGIDRIKEACPLFAQWIEQMKSINMEVS